MCCVTTEDGHTQADKEPATKGNDAQHTATQCSAVTAGLVILATVSCSGHLFAIVCTLHQPPIDTCEGFDKLLLLKRTVMSSATISQKDNPQ